MCKFTVLLTDDNETIIVTHGEPVEDAPSFMVDLSNAETTRTLAQAIDDARKDIETSGTLIFMLLGGPYAPELAAQYNPVKVAEFEVEREGLHEEFAELKVAE